jgi:hypothetical protein
MLAEEDLPMEKRRPFAGAKTEGLTKKEKESKRKES